MNDNLQDEIAKHMAHEMYKYAVDIIPLFVMFARYKGFALINVDNRNRVATDKEIKQLQRELLDELLKD